jgi:hypothetical protein
MDERQAEAIAKSLLEPELKAREVRQEELLERQRRVAFNSSPLRCGNALFPSLCSALLRAWLSATSASYTWRGAS